MAAWVLNLDADLELGALDRGEPYEPSLRVRAAMRHHIERLRVSLLAPNDVLVDDRTVPSRASGLPGRAFCPTPRAMALLRRAGAAPDPHPSAVILRRVNSRAFASSLGATLPGAAFVTEIVAAEARLCSELEVGSAWRVKHAFGMTGRNQRVVRARPPKDEDLSFVRRGLAGGGVQIEPDVPIVGEYAIHGFVRQDGSFDIGALVRQRCDARGAWLATERVDEAERRELERIRNPMQEEAHRVARALGVAGYFGPFGVDAFVYRDRFGGLRLQPRSEINARYSMGFSIGFGAPP